MSRPLMYIDADEYGEIVTAALMDGFEHESRTGYVGNRHIRSSLEEAAKRVASQNHHVIVDSIQTWIERNTIDGRESWFYHMLRGLITKLMANVSCSNQDATSLATLFKQVNRLQRQHPGDKENPEVLLSRPHR